MKIKADIAKDLLFDEDVEGFEVIDDGEWISGGKFESKTVLLKALSTGKFYWLSDSRQGSYHTDYVYDSDYWRDEVELLEVHPVQKTITVYELTTNKG